MDINQAILEIIEEINRFDLREFHKTASPKRLSIPTFIPAGNDRTYSLTERASDILDSVGLYLYREKEEHQEQFTESDFKRIVRTCCGLAISSSEEHTGSTEFNYEQALRSAVLQSLKQNYSERIFFFGAVLVEPHADLDIKIGYFESTETALYQTSC